MINWIILCYLGLLFGKWTTILLGWVINGLYSHGPRNVRRIMVQICCAYHLLEKKLGIVVDDPEVRVKALLEKWAAQGRPF